MKATVRNSTRKAPSTVLISNALSQAPDEGIRRVAIELSKTLQEFQIPTVEVSPHDPLLSRKLLLKSTLQRAVQGKPQPTILYIPSQSMTFGTFLRVLILKRYCRRLKVIVLSCQPASSFAGERLLANLGGPDLVLSPSPTLVRQATSFALKARFIPLAVDTNRFVPGSEKQRFTFREKNGLELSDRLILHVGHLRKARNLGWMHLVTPHGKAVVVAGTSRGYDPEVLEEVRAAGIRTLTRHIANIQDVYGAADCYVFPVIDERGSVGVPLSVLEAMACNLPVVTTPFGGLPTMFGEGNGLFFASNPSEWAAKVADAIAMPLNQIHTRVMVERFTWKALAHELVTQAQALWN